MKYCQDVLGGSLFIQKFHRDAATTIMVYIAMFALSLCASASIVQAVDCNGNGIEDVTDIVIGTSADCDANMVPDECDPDFDGDGVIDACDNCPNSANSNQGDLDGNGIGDACDSTVCDTYWLPRLSEGIVGPNAGIAGAVEWDPDGEGPEASWLVLDGSFTLVDGQAAEGIVGWDGANWRHFSSGSGISTGRLMNLGGNLVAVGYRLSSSDSYKIAKWNGSEWIPMWINPGEYVEDICYYDGDIVACGRFNLPAVGSVPVIRWDGSQWVSLSVGITNSTDPGSDANSLMVWDGHLIVAGRRGLQIAGSTISSDRGILRWDGSTWSGMGLESLSSSRTGRLFSYDGALCVYYSAGTPTANNSTSYYRWDGTLWDSFGAARGGDLPWIADEAEANGFLYAGGKFSSVVFWPAGHYHGCDCDYIARFDGEYWTPVGNEIRGLGNDGVRSVWHHGTDVFLTGEIASLTNRRIRYVARWDGANWHAIGNGITSQFADMLTFQNDLYIYGGFYTSGGAQNIGRWDGSEFRNLTGKTATSGAVNAFTNYEGKLYVGGGIFSVENQGVNRIGEWNGDIWTDIDYPGNDTITGMTTFKGELYTGNLVGNGVNVVARKWTGSSWSTSMAAIAGAVYSFAEYKNDLYAAGSFRVGTQSNTTRSIAKLVGNTWLPLGTGFSNANFGPIYSLAVHDGYLVAAGKFTLDGPDPAVDLARWDGTTWSSFSSPIASAAETIYAMTTYAGRLYVAGSFVSAGGQTVNNIASWGDNSWQGLGTSNLGVDGTVKSLFVHDNELYVGGTFTHADGISVGGLARWNGSAWRDVPADFGGNGPTCFAVYDGALFAGGSFQTVNGVPSASLVRAVRSQGPILTEPQNIEVCELNDAQFTADVDAADVAYQWLFNGVVLMDGGEISGAQEPTLSISQATAENVGLYQCLVSSADCVGTTRSATLEVRPRSDGDGNLDGKVDARDLVQFIASLLESEPAGDLVCAFDMNADGLISSQDIPLFADYLVIQP